MKVFSSLPSLMSSISVGVGLAGLYMFRNSVTRGITPHAVRPRIISSC